MVSYTALPRYSNHPQILVSSYTLLCCITLTHLLSVTVIDGLGSLSYFQKVLTPEIERFLNSTPELTLFMPLDSAWESLDPLERLYLESDFAADDLRRILDMHVVSESGVRWSNSFRTSTECV